MADEKNPNKPAEQDPLLDGQEGGDGGPPPEKKPAAKSTAKALDKLVKDLSDEAREELLELVENTRDQAGKYRKTLREVEKERNDLKAKFEEQDRKAQEEKGQYKELYEKEKQKSASEVNTMKQRLVKAELRARAVYEGISDPDLVELISTKDLDIDAAGDVVGLEDAIAKFKENKPHFFKKGDEGSSSGTKAAATGSTKGEPPANPSIQPDNVRSLSKEDYANRKKEMLAKIHAKR